MSRRLLSKSGGVPRRLYGRRALLKQIPDLLTQFRAVLVMMNLDRVLNRKFEQFLVRVGRKRHRAIHFASVPIPKFLCTFCMCVECAAAEAFDGSEDGIGRFCPAERLGRGISDFDISGDRGFQLGDGSMRAALDLLLGQEREETLDLIDTG